MLMQNRPNPNFEIDFPNGLILSHVVGTKSVFLKNKGGQTAKVSLQHDKENYREVLDIFYAGIHECLTLDKTLKLYNY